MEAAGRTGLYDMELDRRICKPVAASLSLRRSLGEGPGEDALRAEEAPKNLATVDSRTLEYVPPAGITSFL